MLNRASSLELFQLSTIIERMLADPRRILAVRTNLHLGQTVRFLDWRDGQMRTGKVVAMKDTQATMHEEGSRREWKLPYAAIEPPAATAVSPAEAPASPAPARPSRNDFRCGEKVSFEDSYLQTAGRHDRAHQPAHRHRRHGRRSQLARWLRIAAPRRGHLTRDPGDTMHARAGMRRARDDHALSSCAPASDGRRVRPSRIVPRQCRRRGDEPRGGRRVLRSADLRAAPGLHERGAAQRARGPGRLRQQTAGRRGARPAHAPLEHDRLRAAAHAPGGSRLLARAARGQYRRRARQQLGRWLRTGYASTPRQLGAPCSTAKTKAAACCL